MTHKQQRARRKKIADYVQRGHSLMEAAHKFGVTYCQCRVSCFEHGVKLDRRPGNVGRTSMFAVLGDWLQTRNMSATARRMRCTRQYVFLVVEEAEKFGIMRHVTPARRKNRKEAE